MQIENDYPQTLGNTPAQLASTFGPLHGATSPSHQDLAHPGAPKFAIVGETTFRSKAGYSKVY